MWTFCQYPYPILRRKALPFPWVSGTGALSMAVLISWMLVYTGHTCPPPRPHQTTLSQLQCEVVLPSYFFSKYLHHQFFNLFSTFQYPSQVPDPLTKAFSIAMAWCTVIHVAIFLPSSAHCEDSPSPPSSGMSRQVFQGNSCPLSGSVCVLCRTIYNPWPRQNLLFHCQLILDMN